MVEDGPLGETGAKWNDFNLWHPHKISTPESNLSLLKAHCDGGGYPVTLYR